MKKRTIFTLLLTGAAGLAQAAAPTGHVQSATAVSRVLGDGRKVETVVLEYDAPVRDKSLTAESYAVEGREVTRIYANTVPERAEKGTDGRYVVIELKTEVDLNAQPEQPTEADMEKKRERDRMQGGPGLRAGWSTGGDDEYPATPRRIRLRTSGRRRARPMRRATPPSRPPKRSAWWPTTSGRRSS